MHDSISMKYTELANLWTQKAGQWLAETRRGENGMFLPNINRIFLWGDEKFLELDSGVVLQHHVCASCTQLYF